MPRIPRSQMFTSFFHVVAQGINKEYIFQTKKDILYYKSLLLKYKHEYDVSILAYCIMNNHVHLLIYTNKIKELSAFMHRINMIYALYYNGSRKRVGYVFRNRYKSEAILDEKHLLNCIVYIHKNPINANICKTMMEYEFSSYHEYIGKTKIIPRKSLGKLFGNLGNFNIIHRAKVADIFFECDEEMLKTIINEYLQNNNCDKNNILKEKEILKKLVTKLKIEKGISYRKLAKYLNISRETIRVLVNEELPK